MMSASSPELAAAYAHCRAIAKAQARNFYYAFRVLPRDKSDAMCAVYAFMRKADDLADDESLTKEHRRGAMAEWTSALYASRTQPTSDPVFTALNHTQQRFGIPDTLLDQLVQGTTMDLQSVLPGTAELTTSTISDKGRVSESFQVYETFDDLYRYCYLVASVVGLVCIRIFGYRNAGAEGLAEQTGIAFQLTNILRDISEDAARGRVYLPLDDMTSLGVSVEQLSLAARNVWVPPEVLDLVRLQLTRAENYYRASDELIPLLSPDSRPAMRVLVKIYRGLLDRIAADPAAVFHKRVSVPTPVKLAILGRGVIGSWFARGT